MAAARQPHLPAGVLVSRHRDRAQVADPPRALARTGRLLLALVFAFAVIWKAVVSPDYLDGRFFAVTLLTDDRFSDAVKLVGGLSQAQLAESREYLTPLPEGAELLDPPRLHATPRFRRFVLRRRGARSRSRPGRRALAAAVARRRLLLARHGAVLCSA